jgi:hypothetical protein
MVRPQRVPIKAQALEGSRHERLHEHVVVRQHAKEQLAPFRRFQIQRDEALVARVDLPPQRSAGRGPLPQGIAGDRLFDLDDVGAEVGQQHAGDATRHHARQVENPDAFEGLHDAAPQRPRGRLRGLRVYLSG